MQHLLQEITPWVAQYGVLVVFFGMIFEGTMTIIATGVLCYLGLLPIKETIVFAILGATVGDQLWFLAGKYFIASVLKHFPKFEEKIVSLEETIKKRGNLLAFGSRFIYGGATVFPLALGTYGYSHKKFTIFDLMGVSLWATVGISIGYFAGNSIDKIKSIEYLLFVFIFMIGAVWIFRSYNKKHL